MKVFREPLAIGSPPEAGSRLVLVTMSVFYALKIAVGVAIIAASATWLTVADFANFTQFSLLLAYLTLVSSGGVVNGVIKQVSSACGNADREREIIHAGLLIWVVVSLSTFFVAAIFAAEISTVLTGGVKYEGLVRDLSLLSILAGLGQILCGVLIGSDRATRSICYQIAGISIGSATSLYALKAQEIELAILGLAMGPALVALLALVSVPGVFSRRVAWSNLRSEVLSQLNFAAAFLVSASFPPLVLFGLRDFFRETYGVTMLAYWLFANRISDISTQFIGLYLTQIFLRKLTVAGASQKVALVLRALVFCSLMSIAALIMFLFFGGWAIDLLMDNELGNAMPFIMGYLLGDVIRSWSSVAMIGALALARPLTFAAIEVAAFSFFALIFFLVANLGFSGAPYVAYPVAFLAASVLAWWYLVPELRPALRLPSLPW